MNEAPSRLKHFPLRPTLVFTVILIILFTATGVGVPAYFSAKKSIEVLWNDLGNQIASSTTERSLRYLYNALPFTELTTHLVEIDDVKLNEEMKVLDLCYFAVQANPHFNWVSFAKIDGTFLAAYRLSDGTIEATLRKIDNKTEEAPTLIQNFQMGKDHQWTLVKEYHDKYDPRDRPFWKDGLSVADGAWSNPYVIYTSKEPAIAYTKPQYLQGNLAGMWIVEFVTTQLGEFLKNLKNLLGGEVYLVTDDGIIVADSERQNTVDELSQTISTTSGDWAEGRIIKQAWEKSQKLKEQSETLSIGDYFAHIQHFPLNSEIPWNVITIIPKDKFFGPIKAEGIHAILFSLALCIVFTILGAFFFGHISKRLKNMAEEMSEIGAFNFTKTSKPAPSFVREVNMMNMAAERMKIGLSSFAKYVPVDLIYDLLRSGQEATLSGKKVEMTTLFTDLANFTSLAEKLNADELLELLGEYLAAMSDAVHEHKGEVDKYIGDAIMAIWGAPEPLENHQLHACFAALAMKEKLEGLWRKWGKEGKPLLSHRIGINSGIMVVGNIGSPTRMEYTAIGDAVNLASRLEGLNKFYGTQILIGEETALKVENEVVLRPIDWVSVKGRSHPLLIYELIGRKQEVVENTIVAINIYKQGLEHYKNKDFALAIELFNDANVAFGGSDSPSLAMISKAQDYLKIPPADDWRGATVMKEK